MDWCKIKHKWFIVSEPNNIGFTLKYCKRCKMLKRYSVHSGNWFTITENKEQYLKYIDTIK